MIAWLLLSCAHEPASWSHTFPGVARQPFAAYGLGDVTVVVAPNGTGAIQTSGVARDGSVKWALEPGCPLPEARPRVLVAHDTVVCLLDQAVIGTLANGKSWKRDLGGRVWTANAVSDGLVVDVDHKSLVVLDLTTGEPVRRLDVPGQLLGAGDTDRGPIAAVIRSSDLTTELHGLDLRSDGATPVWTRPYADLTSSSVVSGGVLLAAQFATVDRWDLATGERTSEFSFWRQQMYTDRHQVVWGDAGGSVVVAAMDPRTRAVAWEIRWPWAEPPAGALESGGRVIVPSREGTLVLDAVTGAPVGAGPGLTDPSLRALTSLDGAIAIGSGSADVTLTATPLAAAPPLAYAAMEPAWLATGTTLTYSEIRADRKEGTWTVVIDTAIPFAWHLEVPEGTDSAVGDAVRASLTPPAAGAPSWYLLPSRTEAVMWPAFTAHEGATSHLWSRAAPLALDVVTADRRLLLVAVTPAAEAPAPPPATP